MNNHEMIYHDGDRYFSDLFENLLAAKKSIYIEIYIFELDDIGNKILDLLQKISQKGIEVKILLDGFGSSQWNFETAELWRKKNIQIRFFHPLAWQKSSNAFWNSLTIRKIYRGFSKFQLRNHRKICIIDEKTLFTGSHNFSKVHSVKCHGEKAWRDTSLKLTNIDLSFDLSDFHRYWEFSNNYFKMKWNEIRFQKKHQHMKLLDKIALAKNRVWITNPYFVPDLKFISSIRKAGKAGVSVKILLPHYIGIYFFKYAVESIYSLLLACRVEIFEYMPTMLHAKILIIDNWISVGSSNLDYRSIFYNLEKSVVINDEDNKKSIEIQFFNDLKFAEKIDPVIWKNRSWITRLFEKIFILFRPIL